MVKERTKLSGLPSYLRATDSDSDFEFLSLNKYFSAPLLSKVEFVNNMANREEIQGLFHPFRFIYTMERKKWTQTNWIANHSKFAAGTPEHSGLGGAAPDLFFASSLFPFVHRPLRWLQSFKFM